MNICLMNFVETIRRTRCYMEILQLPYDMYIFNLQHGIHLKNNEHNINNKFLCVLLFELCNSMFFCILNEFFTKLHSLFPEHLSSSTHQQVDFRLKPTAHHSLPSALTVSVFHKYQLGVSFLSLV